MHTAIIYTIISHMYIPVSIELVLTVRLTLCVKEQQTNRVLI